MDLVAYLFTVTMFWKTTLSLRCYKCAPDRESSTTPCHIFNYSDEFVKECPISTMCYKKVITMDFGNGKTELMQRGCAPQTMDGYQEKINGKWRKVDLINEVYDDKCTADSTYSERVTETVHCYCRGDLCNHAEPLRTINLGILITCVAVMLIQQTSVVVIVT